MGETCKTCRFWKEPVLEDSRYGLGGKLVDTDWKRGCVRFPKWEVTLSSHYCAEHQPTPEASHE